MAVKPTLASIWVQAADDLGIQITSPFVLALEDGVEIQAPVRVHDFGAPNGMLIVSDYSVVASIVSQIEEMGYGFSVLSEPDEDESYVRDDYIELLKDWGWTGDELQRPGWLSS